MTKFQLVSMALWLLAKACQRKNNKPWAQFRCQNPAGGFLEKCEPVWLEINKDGKWVKQKGRG